VALNDRLQHDPKPVRKLNPEISAQLQEIVECALERDPRRRYATASDMAWELTHQEQVGVAEGERSHLLRSLGKPGARKLLLYAGLALVPVALFALMLLLARG
jgi:serine/threonine protein kinase